MQSKMPPQAYLDQAWFERERELLFKPLWQFIGLKVMLAQHNAFIARTLFGMPVVVQNFQGELHAFENVCLHRQNPIQTQPHGVRPLVCGYHGWGYDRDGAAANIPYEEQLYRFPPQERACLHLRRFALACVGNLVFINLSENPLPIEAQFSPAMLASMAGASEAFDGEVIHTTYDGRFNWKLAYENLRDGHHPRYLHARTLYKETKFQASVDEAGVSALRRLQAEGDGKIGERERALELLRSFSWGGRDAPMEAPPREIWHANVERMRDLDGEHHDWYYNWLAFPNLHIASANGGHSFIVEHHVPVAPGQTELAVYYVTAKKKRPYAYSAAVLHASMMGADAVLREDIDVMEAIQRTLHVGARPAHLGDYEFVNAGIEHWYLNLMEANFAL
jgi:phenylpropionate dioxygenase-like ring-hydroxylating dioxygenase large terminal subunit